MALRGFALAPGQLGALVWGSAGAVPRSGGTRAGCGKRSCRDPGEGWAAAEGEGGLQAACTRAALSPPLSAGCGHSDALALPQLQEGLNLLNCLCSFSDFMW